MTTTQFCPQCQAKQPTFEFEGNKGLLIRCQACGFPVNEELPGESASQTNARGPVVLHIDHDAPLRRLVTAMLKRGGFTPLTASGGEAGLRLAILEHPAAVLLDVMMPGMNGYDVCRRLRAVEKFNDLAIVMLTAPDRPPDITSFLAGADLAIRKPFEESKLLSVLRNAIQLKKN